MTVISSVFGASEGFVQLPTDGAGKQIRAFPLSVNQPQPDGTFVTGTVYQQVFMLGDDHGNLLAFEPDTASYVQVKVFDEETHDLLKEIRDLLTQQIELLQGRNA